MGNLFDPWLHITRHSTFVARHSLLVFFRMNFYPFKNDIIHLLRRYRPLGGELSNAGLEGIHIMERMGALDYLQVRIFRADRFDKFFREGANLYQARSQVQGLNSVFFKSLDFLPDAVRSETRGTSSAADDTNQLRRIIFRVLIKHSLSVPQVAETADHHAVHITGGCIAT